MTLLAGRGLALVRGGRLLFEDIDLSLGAGEALHITGPNGSGKSSLIRLVAGLLHANAGTIERGEAALADEAMALDRELPLRRALSFWNGSSLDTAMDAFAIAHLADIPVRILSTGQRKRAVLARVMASRAPLWLLDEPVNGLDRDGAERLTKAVMDHRASGGAVLAASHVPLGGDWRELAL
nr:heme ABC exporter ATP-binding protein CcmA [uncultured Sphingomonas sp.]